MAAAAAAAAAAAPAGEARVPPIVRAYVSALGEERGGFNFENAARNAALLAPDASGAKSAIASSLPVRHSGTTICGLVTREGLVIGSDTRATEGDVVSDKRCNKLHRLADNIWAGGAGGAADLDHTERIFRARLKLQKLASGGRPIRFQSALVQLSQYFFRYQGLVQCALVVGGVDLHGAQLAYVSVDGNSALLPFASMGSGSPYATAVLERGFSDDLTLAQGVELVADAIQAGVMNDLYSGTVADICTVDLQGRPCLMRAHRDLCPRTFRLPAPPKFEKGSSVFAREKVEVRGVIVAEEVVEERAGAQ